MSQSSLKISRHLKLSNPRLITTLQKSCFLMHYSLWRVVLLARRAMKIAHSLWRVMLLVVASDEGLHGQNAVFPKNPNFLSSNPQNDLQKCNKLLSITWMHSNAITMLFAPFPSKNHTPKPNPQIPNFN